MDVRLRSLPDSYMHTLGEGGIVEEMIAGEIRSPSVQMRILPGGEPLVISTHDQVLGGTAGQSFVACTFPADPEYAAIVVHEARNEAYRPIRLADFLAAARAEGVSWDAETQTGAVFHMLSLLESKGRLGVTAIADSPPAAQELYLRVVELLDRLAAGT